MSNKQALIIDDNVTNILVLQQLLSIESIDAQTISNTRNFCEQLDTIDDIDIVFLDLEMPVIDGYDAIKLIKSHPNFTSAKVIAYSVHVSEIHNVLAMGFDGFIGKPLNAEQFPEQLSRILNGESVRYIP